MESIRKTYQRERDEIHASYDPVYAHRFWRILTQTVFSGRRAPNDKVLSKLSTRFGLKRYRGK